MILRMWGSLPLIYSCTCMHNYFHESWKHILLQFTNLDFDSLGFHFFWLIFTCVLHGTMVNHHENSPFWEYLSIFSNHSTSKSKLKQQLPRITSMEVEVDYLLSAFSIKTIVLVRVQNQEFQGTIIFMVFDLQGRYMPNRNGAGVFTPTSGQFRKYLQVDTSAPLTVSDKEGQPLPC